MTIAVTGDVDSGKSTCIGRLLYEGDQLPVDQTQAIKDKISLRDTNVFAQVLDSFEEERKGEMTIDTTCAFLNRKQGRACVFVDVPGHQELLQNMLCGASSASRALLLIDAQKSIQDQTKRHAFILQLLGITEIIVLVNKMDMVEYSESVFKAIVQESDKTLSLVNMTAVQNIPISAYHGDNLSFHSSRMRWYNGPTLLGFLDVSKVPIVKGPFRFPVQDLYMRDGKTFAVGQIISGEVRKNSMVMVLPKGVLRKIREIRLLKTHVISAKVPQSAGIVLDSMEGVQRGDVFCLSPFAEIATCIAAHIYCVRAFTSDTAFFVQCGTAAIKAVIKKVHKAWDSNNGDISIGRDGQFHEKDAAAIELQCQQPVSVDPDSLQSSLGRFVLKGQDGEIYALGMIKKKAG